MNRLGLLAARRVLAEDRLPALEVKARQKIAMIAQAMVRPIGEGGVSTTSSAAGRNASSSLSRASFPRNGTTVL